MACAECGRTDDLSIDHILPRRLTPQPGISKDVGHRLWVRLKREGYPDGYTVLCRACNSSKSSKGVYPRDEQRRPFQSVRRRSRIRGRATYVYDVAWLRPGHRGYRRSLAEAQANQHDARMARSSAHLAYRIRVWRLKERFERETGVRVPLYGGRGGSGRVGWLQILSEFHRDNPSRELSDALLPFKRNLRGPNRILDEGALYTPYSITMLVEVNDEWRPRLWSFVKARLGGSSRREALSRAGFPLATKTP